MENKAGYRVIISEGTGEITEKKSRFIATVFRVENVQEAEDRIAEMQKKYWDARHNCYAFVLGADMSVSRCSDNGEPSGTAGKPILEVIKGAGVTNVLIVVTRYFGGVLLGTGGLVRAYTQAAQAGLTASVIGDMCYGERLHLTADYGMINNIQYFLRQEEIPLENEIYTDKVEYDITVRSEGVTRVTDGLIQKTEGKIAISKIEEGYFPF